MAIYGDEGIEQKQAHATHLTHLLPDPLKIYTGMSSFCSSSEGSCPFGARVHLATVTQSHCSGLSYPSVSESEHNTRLGVSPNFLYFLIAL